MPNIIKSAHCHKANINTVKTHDKPTEEISSNEHAAVDLLVDERKLAEEESEKLICEAKKQADNLIAQAKAQAEQMISQLTQDAQTQLKAERDRCIKEAFDEGYANGKQNGVTDGFREGYQDGILQAKNEQDLLTERMHQLLVRIDSQKEHTLETFYESLQDRIFDIAKIVIKEEVNSKPEYLVKIAKDLLIDHQEETCVKIILSQENFDLLQELSEPLGDHIKLIADPNLTDGDCMIDTPSEVYDIGIDTQFANIADALSEMKNHENK